MFMSRSRLSWYLKICLLVVISYLTLNLHGPLALAQFDDDLKTYQPPKLSCPDLDFFWEGAHYQMGKQIGSGLYGMVFDLLHDGEIPGQYVLKILTSPEAEDAYRGALDEVKLYKSLPRSFVPTHYKSVYELPSAKKRYKYGALLIKEKVIGYTLFNFLEKPHLLKDFPPAYETLLKFKKTLIDELAELARKDIYVWDLHANNIMYDIIRREWKVVDAEREVTLTGFKKSILSRVKYAPKNHPVHDINALLTGGILWTEEQLTSEIVSIYFEHILAKLLLIKKRAS